MLYIFLVDTGTMMTFDMNLALESVVQLKEAIERTCRIPSDKQVLLVSGGESLDPGARVCSYSAGTDTNPIYLFSKCAIESATPPLPSIDPGSDIELKDQVEGSLSLPATYNTVVVRAQLAQQFCELAREQTRICERLVHDQHLQQQGWAAVVANLEDITALFRSHAEVFKQSFTQYLGSRADFMVLLESFSQDLQVLSKIPIVPALLAEQRSAEAQQGKPDRGGADAMKEREGEGDCLEAEERVTLLQWISDTDDQSNLEQISETCVQGLNKFDERVFDSLSAEIVSVFDGANKTDYKEIKGLEERLFGLEQLMFETKHIVQEQGDLAQSFLQNQHRASNLGDASILPDLCASHRRQLLVMLKNHQQLRDIRRRCSKAKEELCINLYHRLRWIMYVENNMVDLERRLNLYHDGLKRLRRRLEVVQQIHLAPAMYLNAVGEVVRRRTFSHSFLVWASDLACQLQAVHSDEVARRREFQTRFDGHFLNALFPGLEDAPPAFATQAPPTFDGSLPKLTAVHVERLRSQIPDLVLAQSWPDLDSITQFFAVKPKLDSMEERLVKTLVSNESVSSPTNFLQDTSTNKEQDCRGFESETDTEEFEKVAASPMDIASVHRSTTSADAVAALEVCDWSTSERKLCPVSTSTSPVTFQTSDCYIDESLPSSFSESVGSNTRHATRPLADLYLLAKLLKENLGSTRCEVERLRTVLTGGCQTAGDACAMMRDEISLLRSQAIAQRDMFAAVYHELVAALEAKGEAEARERGAGEREIRQRLTVDHELEMESLRQEMKLGAEGKTAELRLQEQASGEAERQLRAELAELRQHCTHMQLSLETSEVDKQRAVKEVTDRLTHDYKTELENLRSRFRLMATASMERSPSDSSLEKIGRSEHLIELANHEAILAQVRADLVDERERVADRARQDESTKWETRLELELKQARSRTEQEKQVWFNETMRRVVADKDRQLDAARAREAALLGECRRHQEVREGDWPRLEALETEKARLESELAEERGRRRNNTSESDVGVDMSTSVAVVQENVFRDAATSPEPQLCNTQEEQVITHKLTRSTNALIQQGKISIMSCNAGDAVLVVWDEDHSNYTVLQEMSTLYFLHSDCLDALGLNQRSDGSTTRRLYATGEVMEKEYCHAKKSENRYRVPKGTKFYRVRVRPLQKESLMVRSHHHHHHHSAPPGSSHQPGTL